MTSQNKEIAKEIFKDVDKYLKDLGERVNWVLVAKRIVINDIKPSYEDIKKKWLK